MKKVSSKRATKSQKSTSSTRLKSKKLEATTDTAWEKLASTPTDSTSAFKKTDKFPWEMFPIRLDIKTEKRVCWFQCEDHLNKLLEREKLKPKDYNITTNGVALVGKKPRRKSRKK